MRGRRHGCVPIIIITGASAISACHSQQNASARHPAPAPMAQAAAGAAGSQPSTGPTAQMLGADLGAAGGWLIAAAPEKLAQHSAKTAQEASRRAEQHPASAADARAATSADLNNDGFVTLDEVLAMKRAGFDDAKMIRQLRATGQVFSITDRQQQYLRDRGIDQSVMDAMKGMNQNAAVATH
jgi:hypothetical protein